MTFNIKGIITLWNIYCVLLPLHCCEFEKCVKIINLIQKDEILSQKDKKELYHLTELLAESIYKDTYNDCDLDDECYYQKTKIYDKQELNYCSTLLLYLEKE
jgi:hypothetical protein